MPREHTWRYVVLGLFFVLLGALILYKAFSIQRSPDAIVFLRQSEYYSRLLKTVYPPRGEIYDRNGRLLAGNRTVYEIGIELGSVLDPKSIALALSALVGTDYNYALKVAGEQPGTNSIYAVVDDYVLPEKIDLLKTYDVNRPPEPHDSLRCSNDPALIALVCRPHLARSYPERDLASNLLGFVNREGQGNFGIEQQYQDLLAGLPEEICVPTDPNRVQELPVVPPGGSLVLTLDREIQAMVEDLLDANVKKTGAVSGTVIVMDPKNGEILAMASTPRMDLNDYTHYGDIYKPDTPYNRAVGEIYEPGSIFKVVTMSAAIDTGTVKPDTKFIDTGVFNYGGINIRNWNGQAWGEQTMLGCLQHSLNVCLAWVGSELGSEKFYKYVQAYGFGQPTGVDLSGEASGTVKLPGAGDWYPADLAANTFGQGIAITPMQMVMAVSAFINDGQMVIPHIVKDVVQDGVEYSISPQFAGQPISPETAHTMSDMLATSLETEGSLALVSGYRLAGKTGTAQIPSESGYDLHQTNTSFIGWGPLDNPRFIVFVWLERPSTSIWASEVAAPFFSDIVQRLVVLMNIPPDAQRQAMAGQGQP